MAEPAPGYPAAAPNASAGHADPASAGYAAAGAAAYGQAGAAAYGQPGATAYGQPGAAPGYYAPQQMNYYQPGQSVHYAGFWLRFVAAFIDGLIIFVPLVILGIVLVMALGLDPNAGAGPGGGAGGGGGGGGSPAPAILLDLGMRAVGLIVGWLYYATQESGPRQATIGKRAVGLVVTDMEGGRLTFGRASGRYFGKILSNLTCTIGYIMAGFTERRQALHDMVASTLVLKRG